MATQTQILEVLETLTSIYNAEPGEPKGYYWALEEYDADILEAAAKDAVRFCKWYPKPSELREIAERKQNERDKVDDKKDARISKATRDRAYMLYDKYRAGEITAIEFTSDRAASWCYKQHGMFSALFEFEDLVCETPAA